jgi:hypothetical protein
MALKTAHYRVIEVGQGKSHVQYKPVFQGSRISRSDYRKITEQFTKKHSLGS